MENKENVTGMPEVKSTVENINNEQVVDSAPGISNINGTPPEPNEDDFFLMNATATGDAVPGNVDVVDNTVEESVVEEPIIDPNANLVDTYEVKDFKDMNSMYTAPTATYTQLLTFAMELGQDSNFNPDVDNENSLNSVMNNMNGTEKVAQGGVFEKRLENGIFSNAIEYKGKKIEPKVLAISAGSKRDILLAKISKSIAAGENIQMPLINSGFWVTFKPPGASELAVLKRDLDKSNIEIGRETGGLLYSNKNIELSDIAVTFILGKVTNTTLALEEGDDIRDYIFVEDIPILMLGIAMCLFPNGYRATLGCVNSAIYNHEKHTSACTFLDTAIMKLSTLLRIDENRIDDYMCDTLSMRNPGSVTKAQILTYREHLRSCNTEKVNECAVTATDDIEVKFIFESPNLTVYFQRGKLWKKEITKKLEGLVLSPREDKEDIVNDLISVSILGIYNAFIDTIMFDGEKTDGEIDKLEILELLSNDDAIYDAYFKGVLNYISESPIAIIATTNFICPKCGTARKAKKDGLNWDNYVALDPLNYFLDLVTQKLKLMLGR